VAGCRRIVVALIAASAGLLVVSASAWAYQFTLGNVRSHGYVLSGSGDDVGDPLTLELVRRGKHSVETVTFTVARAKVRDGGGCSLHVRARFGRYGAIALTIRPRTSCTEIAPDTSRRAVATGVLVLAIPGGGFTIRLSRLPARVFNQVTVCACAAPFPPPDLGSLLGAGPLTALLPLQGAVSETYDKVRHPERRLTIEDQISERGLPRKLFACHGPEFCDGTEAATVIWGGPYFKGTTDFTPGAATGDAGWLTGSVTITSPFAGTTTVLAPGHRLRATIGYSGRGGNSSSGNSSSGPATVIGTPSAKPAPGA